MSRKITLILICLILLFSCDTEDLKQQITHLEEQIEELNEKVDELEVEKSSLVIDLESCHLENSINKEIIEFKDEQFKKYKTGNGMSLSRFTKDKGKVTIYGAENIIEFLNQHYCP